MTELERRALMGDREAQEECTRQGIVLPCPKCFSNGVKIEGDGYDIYDPDTLGYLNSVPDRILYVICDSCNLCSDCIIVKDGEEREDAEKKLITEWNTRPAPPVGRCGECKYYKLVITRSGSPKKCQHPLSGLYRILSENDFCSYFEPKGDEENA